MPTIHSTNYHEETTVNTETMLQRIIEKANQFKAERMRAIRVTQHCSFADYFVFLSGTSSVHIQATAEAILLDLKGQGVPALGVEGINQGTWCLLDFGDILVHIFHEQSRQFYDLESLWVQAEQVYPPIESPSGQEEEHPPQDLA